MPLYLSQSGDYEEESDYQEEVQDNAPNLANPLTEPI